MSLRLEPGQTFTSWSEFKQALEDHCQQHKVLFSIGHAKTVEQANALLKKPPLFVDQLKYASCSLRCKHYGSYSSLSAGLRPRQRSYKIDCKAFVSVSACRKGGYLIIRDSCHLHSHPCTEEIYNSYPEVRRMSKDEQKMVGTLMEMGVSVSQIKTAIGKHVTPKDLHNARSQAKRARLGLSTDGAQIDKNDPHAEFQATHSEGVGDVPLDSDDEEEDMETMSPSPEKIVKVETDQNVKKVIEDVTSSGAESFALIVQEMGSSLVDGAANSLAVVEAPHPGSDKEVTSSVDDSNGLPGLLAAAGVGSDSVVLTVNQGLGSENTGGSEFNNEQPKNSYTVTISLPDGDVTQTGTDLQELLKSLPLGKIGSNKTEPTHPLLNADRPDHAKVSSATSKNCTKCAGYMSPLDGHSLCLQCLGPDHLIVKDCPHCSVMRPDQLSIRRKQLVRQRMKALKALQDKRLKQSLLQSDSDESSATPAILRKSQRVRKPKNYGPDIAVEDAFVRGYDFTPGIKEEEMVLPKAEPMDHLEGTIFEHQPSEAGELNEKLANSERFEHLLSQTSVLDNVMLEESSDASKVYVPASNISDVFAKAAAVKNLTAFPNSLEGKYALHQSFESEFCSDPPQLPTVADPCLRAMSSGLCKLVKNAAAQTRLAVYDQLFTRLGVSMADEALSIVGDLYGKVTRVTEISQEDLTTNLQTALDTIQALKDVLEELNVMSSDAISTAAHQRSLSLSSLSNAKTSLWQRPDATDFMSRRRKFQPFTRPKITAQVKAPPTVASEPTAASVEATALPSLSLPGQYMKHVVVNVSETDLVMPSVSLLPTSSSAASSSTSHEVDTGPPTEAAPAFINISNKDFSMAPLAVSTELLQSLQGGKEGVIELHVMKDGSELLAAGHGSIEEVIQPQADGVLGAAGVYQLNS